MGIRSRIHGWLRPNAGLDFGAWQFLLHRGVIEHAPFILLANDSVYGPFSALDRFLHRSAALRHPAWGMVASRAGGAHLQSWFVLLSRAVLHAAPVRRVFSLPFADMTREDIIRHAELGLSAAIQKAGFPLHAAWSDLAPSCPRLFPATNPMHARWRSLLASGRVPFIKRELLRDNPFALPGVQDWAASLPPGAMFDPRWVREGAGHPYATGDNTTAATPADRPRPNARARMLYRLVNAADTRALTPRKAVES